MNKTTLAKLLFLAAAVLTATGAGLATGPGELALSFALMFTIIAGLARL